MVIDFKCDTINLGGSMDNKIAASLFGLFIGDAIGVPAKFETRSSLVNNPISDMVGYGTYNVPAGTWSDCSSMTIATIFSVINKKEIDCQDITLNFIKWYQDGTYTPFNKPFAISKSVEKSLRAHIKKINRQTYDDDNSALMRILPISLYCYYKKMSDAETVKVINDVVSITHSNELTKLACFIYTKFIEFLHLYEKKEAYQKLKEIDFSNYYSNEAISQFERILVNNINEQKLSTINSTNFVVDTLEAVFWVILNTDNFIHSIIGAINLGGDTSTIGALTGGMSGIIYGYEYIPEQWLKKLKKLDNLETITKAYEQLLLEI